MSDATAIRRLLPLLVLCLLPLLGQSCHQIRKTPPLRITFLDVGQGDATVIETPQRRVVVVDGGGHPGTSAKQGGDPGSQVVVPYLRQRGISTVDLIVPTHPDDDHVQGLIAVVERLNVRGMLDGNYFDNAASYHELRQTVQQSKIPIHTARRGQQIDLGQGARLEVLHPGNRPILGTASPTNDNSIVLRLVYGKSRILLTGDAAEAAETEMRVSGMDLSADVLKAGHHGSKHSTTADFLKRVHPQVAIISCGKNNTYGHPNREVLQRLEAQNVQIYRTDKEGAIVVETDGEKIRVTPMKGLQTN